MDSSDDQEIAETTDEVFLITNNKKKINEEK